MSSEWIGPQSGNKMFIVCTCGIDPLEFARRKGLEYSESKSAKYHMDQWFTDHAKCPGGPDKFRLAHQYQMNSDQPPAADPVANAVRLELVKS